MVILNDTRVCWHYATLLCAARIVSDTARPGREGLAMNIRQDITNQARELYERAEPAAWHVLDEIKRIMEIDTDVDNPVVVLLRAGGHLI
jgi:hypothetical protein